MTIKPAIVLAEDLPVGLKANFAAVLGMSLGRLMPEFIGDDTLTEDGVTVAGITTVAIPVLSAPSHDLHGLFRAAAALPLRLAYMQSAFEARTYADYTARMASAPLSEHEPQALLLAGPRKAVDRICGRLPLVR